MFVPRWPVLGLTALASVVWPDMKKRGMKEWVGGREKEKERQTKRERKREREKMSKVGQDR